MIRNAIITATTALLIFAGVSVNPGSTSFQLWAQEGYSEASYNGMDQAQRDELIEAQQALDEMEVYKPRQPQRSRRKRNKKILSGNESFIAGPDWEFDGFVVGGQGQEVRSMFVVNDLIYLNVGYSQGFEPGDRIGVFQRGSRIRDPQSGRFLGFEVQQIGTAEITNKIEDETCSVRVVNSNTGIEVGDFLQSPPFPTLIRQLFYSLKENDGEEAAFGGEILLKPPRYQ